MKNKTVKKISIILIILFINSLTAQEKNTVNKEPNKKTELNFKEINDKTDLSKVDSILILKVKNELVEDYKKSKSFTQKELKKEIEKQILEVSWYDAEYKKIKETEKGELISIIVLTRGYKIGEIVEVSIGSDESPDSVLEKEKCNLITFIGQVTHENLAVLKNVFTIEGEKEYIVVNSNWLKKYKCK